MKDIIKKLDQINETATCGGMSSGSVAPVVTGKKRKKTDEDAPADQVKGKQKAKKATGRPDSKHPFQGQQVGESDYDFLSTVMNEQELDEDLITQMRREMNDYMRDRKAVEEQGPEDFAKAAQIKSIRKPTPKKIHSKEDPLMDDEQIEELAPMPTDKQKATTDRIKARKNKKVEEGGWDDFWDGTPEENEKEEQGKRDYMARVKKRAADRNGVTSREMHPSELVDSDEHLNLPPDWNDHAGPTTWTLLNQWYKGDNGSSLRHQIEQRGFVLTADEGWEPIRTHSQRGGDRRVSDRRMPESKQSLKPKTRNPFAGHAKARKAGPHEKKGYQKKDERRINKNVDPDQ